jgi:hypothetical protein
MTYDLLKKLLVTITILLLSGAVFVPQYLKTAQAVLVRFLTTVGGERGMGYKIGSPEAIFQKT